MFLNGSELTLRRASPRPHGPRGLSAVLGRGLVWGRSDRLGPGAQGTLGPSVTVPGRSLGTGDASGPEPAEQEGETSLPPGAVPAQSPPPAHAGHPVPSPPCAPASLRTGLPARPPACGPQARAAPAPASSPAREVAALRGGRTEHSARGRLGSRRPFFLGSASFAPNVLHTLAAVRRVTAAYYRPVGVFYLPGDKLKG